MGVGLGVVLKDVGVIKRTNRCSTHPETDEVGLDIVGLDTVRLVMGNVGLDGVDSLGAAAFV